MDELPAFPVPPTVPNVEEVKPQPKEIKYLDEGEEKAISSILSASEPEVDVKPTQANQKSPTGNLPSLTLQWFHDVVKEKLEGKTEDVDAVAEEVFKKVLSTSLACELTEQKIFSAIDREINTVLKKVLKRKSTPEIGETVLFNESGQVLSGKVIKKTENYLQVKTSDGKLYKVPPEEVTEAGIDDETFESLIEADDADKIVDQLINSSSPVEFESIDFDKVLDQFLRK